MTSKIYYEITNIDRMNNENNGNESYPIEEAAYIVPNDSIQVKSKPFFSSRFNISETVVQRCSIKKSLTVLFFLFSFVKTPFSQITAGGCYCILSLTTIVIFILKPGGVRDLFFSYLFIFLFCNKNF